MGTGGEAGGAHVGDHISLLHACPFLNPLCKAAQVHVGGGVGAVVPDLEVVAGATPLKGFLNHHPVADGFYRCTGRCGIVHPVMGAVAFQHRVEAGVREAGADAEEVEGSFQESLPEAVALFVEVLSHGILFKRNGPVLPATVCEGSSFDGGDLHEGGVIDPCLVVHHSERIALLHIEEIDLPGIDVGEHECQHGGGTRCDDGIP